MSPVPSGVGEGSHTCGRFEPRRIMLIDIHGGEGDESSEAGQRHQCQFTARGEVRPERHPLTADWCVFRGHFEFCTPGLHMAITWPVSADHDASRGRRRHHRDHSL